MLSYATYQELSSLFSLRRTLSGFNKSGARMGYCIPIGCNELIVDSVSMEETAKGKPYVQLKIYCPPSDVVYGSENPLNKTSFVPITCRHYLSDRVDEPLASKWYKQKSFISPLEAQTMLGWHQSKRKDRKRFYGLIRHVQSPYIKRGVIQRDGNGDTIVKWEQEILRVSRTPITDFDYWELVQYAERDRRTVELELW